MDFTGRRDHEGNDEFELKKEGVTEPSAVAPDNRVKLEPDGALWTIACILKEADSPVADSCL
jgi:hypothetical protein